MFDCVAVLGNGLVGEAFNRLCPYHSINITRSDLDLNDTESLTELLKSNHVDLVVNASAIVGGIGLNSARGFHMFSSNTELQLSVLRACIAASVPQAVFFGSNCSYPISARLPLHESALFSGLPHNSNLGYAASKRAISLACIEAHNEYGIKILQPIPCSLFGINDNYDPAHSHFTAAAIRKISDAASASSSEIQFWGTGTPLRELMFADDLVSAVFFLLSVGVCNENINIGTSSELQLSYISQAIANCVGYKGSISWDHSFPDGAKSKLLDSSKLYSLGWDSLTPFDIAISQTVESFLTSKNRI